LINQAESPKSLPTEGDLRDIPSHFDLSTISSNSQSSSSSSHSFLPERADQTLVLYTRTEKLAKYANKPMGFINRTSRAPHSSPSLPLIALPRSSWDVNQLVPFISAPNNQNEEGTWVDLVINNIDDGSHPFHLHGHSFYVLASHRSEHGWGSYNPFSTDTTSNMKSNFNLVNPVRKDTVTVPRRGYVCIVMCYGMKAVGWSWDCRLVAMKSTWRLILKQEDFVIVVDERIVYIRQRSEDG
jgi:hypothetical protein